MSKPLPDRPNLDHLKNEAKALLKAQKRGDRSVCETLRRIARLASASDDEILAAPISLQEAQHAVAVEYGFESWKELKDRVTGQSAFAARVQEALDAFTSEGPDHDSTRSPWEEQRQEATKKLLEAGDEGFRVMMKLARSDNGRARNEAAVFFGLSDDTRAPEQLQSLLGDDAVMVRSRALRFYSQPGAGIRRVGGQPHGGPLLQQVARSRVARQVRAVAEHASNQTKSPQGFARMEMADLRHVPGAGI